MTRAVYRPTQRWRCVPGPHLLSSSPSRQTGAFLSSDLSSLPLSLPLSLSLRLPLSLHCSSACADGESDFKNYVLIQLHICKSQQELLSSPTSRKDL